MAITEDQIRAAVRDEFAAHLEHFETTDGAVMTVAMMAGVAQVHPETVRRWISTGKLRKLSPDVTGSRVLVLRSTFREFLKSADRA